MGLRQNLQTIEQINSKNKLKLDETGEQEMHVMARS